MEILFIGKETIVHTEKQQFHLFIKYQKGGTNKLADMLSRPPTPKITAFGTI